MSDVKVGIGADTSELKSALKDAQSQVEQFKKNAQAGNGSSGGMFAKWGKTIAANIAGGMASKSAWSKAFEAMEGSFDAAMDRMRQRRETRRALTGASSGQARGSQDQLLSKEEQQIEDLARIKRKSWVEKLFTSGGMDFIREKQLPTAIRESQQQRGLAADVSIKAGKEEIPIAIMRAKGNDAAADAAQRELEYKREKLKIERETIGLDPAKRKAMLEQLAQNKKIADASAAINLQESFGMTAIASSKAQLGLGGGVAMFGKNPNEQVLQAQLQVLEEIKTAVQTGTGGGTTSPAFSGPPPSRGPGSGFTI